MADDSTELEFIEGGVTAPEGFSAAGAHIGFRKSPERFDAALVVSSAQDTVATGTFTRNVFCAAPVQVSRSVAAGGKARAVILNSGIANAATGEPGRAASRAMQEITAQALSVPADEVFVASTGVIGVQLPTAPFETGVPQLVSKLSREGSHDAALAIMTTDTHPKECAVEFSVGQHSYRIGGMCKGSGMIQPDMATMLCVLTSDMPVSAEAAHAALKEAVDHSFNKVTVDSDTSTNDSVFLMSSCLGEGAPAKIGDAAFTAFATALRAVCENLARQIAADGEGATKLVTVNVRGAANDADADKAARTIANSPLVKTAIAGHDCNWGRVAAALGRSGAAFEQEKTDIDILGLPVCRDGLAIVFDEEEALRRFEQDEVVIDVDLHQGDASTRIWTCDLTHDYISINADYRS